jgi:NADPH:quinone reductase-like Zn-dependent oxidoreductase
MRAIVLNGGFGLERLAFEERPLPTPGPNQVLVRVRAVSLNYRDLMMVRGEYDPRLKLPLIPCSDASGEVVALGAGAMRFSLGANVCPIFARGWYDGPPTRDTPRSALGGPNDGTLSEYIVAHEEDLVAPPPHLDHVQASTLACAGVTAHRALFEEGHVGTGSRVLVIGTGGVSTFAIQLAREAGAEVFVTGRNPEKLARARELGAHHVTTAEAGFGLTVRKLTGGDGVDLVVEVGGAGTLAESLRAVRASGTIALIGVAAHVTEPPSLVPIVMRNIRVQGILVGPRSTFERLVAAYTKYALEPVVDRVFPFDETQKAFEYLQSGAHFGKVCIEL